MIVKGVASEYINQDSSLVSSTSTSTTSSTTTYQEKDRKPYSTPVKFSNSMNSSTPSKQHSLDYSSSPSSTTSSLNRGMNLDEIFRWLFFQSFILEVINFTKFHIFVVQNLRHCRQILPPKLSKFKRIN